MSFTYTRTSAQIITRALRILGVIQSGATPSTEQYADGLEVLNTVLKDISMEGIVLTKQSLYQPILSATLSSISGNDGNSYECIKSHSGNTDNRPVTGTQWAIYWQKGGNSTTAWSMIPYTSTCFASISGSNGFDTIDRAIWKKNDIDYSVDVIKFNEYMEYADKLTQSEIPEKLAVEYTADAINLYLYPAPSNLTSAALVLSVTSIIDDVSSTSSTPNMTNNWYTTLSYVLASYLCDEYQKPMEERSYLYNKSQELVRKCINNHMPVETGRFVTGAYGAY